MRKVKISDAEARLMGYAAQQYGWTKVLEAGERAPELKRVFNRRTLARLKAAGCIKYRPAQIYVTGVGRAALRRYLRGLAHEQESVSGGDGSSVVGGGDTGG